MSIDDNTNEEWLNNWAASMGMQTLPKGAYTSGGSDINDPWDYNTQPTYEPKKCECGASKVYVKEPNKEYLHADYCPLYLKPNIK